LTPFFIKTTGRWFMQNRESDLQGACVAWFRHTHPSHSKLLFSVPNGAYLHGSKIQRLKQWGRLRREGAVTGVSDLLLLVPNSRCHGLCIEMKTEAKHSHQTPQQKEFERAVTGQNYEYIIIRNFNDFKNTIKNYLHE